MRQAGEAGKEVHSQTCKKSVQRGKEKEKVMGMVWGEGSRKYAESMFVP